MSVGFFESVLKQRIVVPCIFLQQTREAKLTQIQKVVK